MNRIARVGSATLIDRSRPIAALIAALLLIAPLSSAAQAPQRGGTAVIAVPADPGHLNPGISTGSHVHAVADSLYNGLVELDADLSPRPDLAQRWEVSQDGTSYTFKLAPGTRWHDGRPVTAADVKFSFEEILLKHHARARAAIAPILAAIEAPDPQTVVFQLKKPYGALLQLLSVTEAPILPKHVYEGSDALKHPANLKPIGSGPFKFDSYRTDQQVVLVRNADYFKPGLPYLDRLIFRVMPDANSQLGGLFVGEVDFIGILNATDVERARARSDLVTAQSSFGSGGGNCIMTMSFNLERKAVADLAVRQAIAHAIDRETMVKLVLSGIGRVADAPVSAGLAWAHAPGTLARYAQPDPPKATALLDAAGLRPDAEGTRLTIDLLHFPTFNRYAELIRQQLAKVGIKVVSKPLDRAAFVEAVFTRREFDTNLISYCNGADPDAGVRRMYVSDNIGNVPFSNAAAYRNAEVDRLFALAGSTADYAERGRHYKAIQKIVSDELPYWWLVETVVTSAWRDNLAGFRPWSGNFAERAFRKR